MHYSVATLSSPEFIDLQPCDINPLMSKCSIKVLYLGDNRNGSVFTKEVAQNMAKTLRGAPIVGYYWKEKEDFSDHGEKITIENGEIKFSCNTIPYGFVSPDAQVWFQDFEDDHKDIRTYLMTTGYIWTGQMPESQSVIDEGRPQSMELDERTLKGQWTEDQKTGMEFFIVSDAIFSKLCILGNDVEPCFEGSSITSLENFDANTNFTLDTKTTMKIFYSMMNIIQTDIKGGNNSMNENKDNPVISNDAPIPESDFANKNNQEKEDEAKKDKEEKSADSKKENPTSDNKEEDKKKEEKYTAMAERYTELENKYSQLEKQFKELQQFKIDTERTKKQELINTFSALEDTDKTDVITNIDKYSYEEIESKLAVIAFRKGVNFTKEKIEEEAANEIKPAATFSLSTDTTNVDGAPAWLNAAKAIKAKRA